ncbi:enoyl-CoA hydratase/isomerase family protein [Variovorax sp. J22P271]|uniref:enoyl-CoA hydratase/isomerase family protein n=1 Tax=Variovorax davisae TaxID=3053515 RepID=UPI0025767692|nr:enoyl-CoA hydratase/isomerase family protein [Variovorax sp. J22P271]MDM0032423.1 enoyl-CoA hydratase/isomerase family protein [Variovorax sp. J22P271]
MIVEKNGPVARLVLNRPEKHNALRFDDLDILVAALHEAEDDDAIKVIVLKGNGPSFCAGHDYNDALMSYGLEPAADGSKLRRPSQRTRLLRDRKLGMNYMAFQNSMKPVIAQVHGHCTGVGMYFVELVDLAIAADDTYFSHAEQRLGLAGNTWHMNSQILMYGAKKARELMLLGDSFDGPEAHRFGLVNLSVPQAQLEATVENWAQRISKHARDALVTGKAMHQMALESLGGAQQFTRGYVGHTLGTNLRFEPDEFNFLRERAQEGTTATFKKRDERFGD